MFSCLEQEIFTGVKMNKYISQKVITVVLILAVFLSACQNTPATQALEETLQAAVVQTLTSAPSATPFQADTPTPTSTSAPAITPTAGNVSYGPTNFPANVTP
jgi:hypothetical protein